MLRNWDSSLLSTPSKRAFSWSTSRCTVLLAGPSQSYCTPVAWGSARITSATWAAMLRTCGDVITGDAELHRESHRRTVLKTRHPALHVREIPVQFRRKVVHSASRDLHESAITTNWAKLRWGSC